MPNKAKIDLLMITKNASFDWAMGNRLFTLPETLVEGCSAL
jgi:hypothetical protein